jgi:hypothetical protein
MPVPDRNADEPTRAIDKDYWKLYLEAKGNAKAWQSEAMRLRGLLEEQIGDAYAATVEGRKVLTYRPGNSYATTALRHDYPDLTERFMRQEISHTLDMDAFSRAHPELAEQYRVRSFREVDTGDE